MGGFKGVRAGVVVLLVLPLLFVLVPPTQVQATKGGVPESFGTTAIPRAPGPSVTDEELSALTNRARGRVHVSENADGRIEFARVTKGGDLMPDVEAGSQAKAEAFLDSYAGLLGGRRSELAASGSRRDLAGESLSYTQSFEGIPVWGGGVRFNFDDAQNLTSVNGYLLDGLSGRLADPAPAVTSAQAEALAVAEVRADPPMSPDDHSLADTSQVRPEPAELVIYPLGAVRGQPGTPVLAWQVDVSDGGQIAEQVLLSADSGKLLNRLSTRTAALDRQLNGPAGQLWREGDALPGTLSGEQQNVLATTADTYWFFQNAWGRDGAAGDGAPYQILQDDTGQEVTCPNAAWDDGLLAYCPGMGVDDVIAHEWAHAYTDSLSPLVYQWQPGALNEAYSDIWGETIDLINAREDAEEGAIASPRPAGCSTASPVVAQVLITAPIAIAKECIAAGATFGAPLSAGGVSASVAVANDADEDGPEPFQTTADACSAITNGGAVAGRIALVDRGGCSSTTKAANVQAAGAVGLVVVNTNNAVFRVTGTNAAVTIPAVSIPASDGQLIRATLANQPVSLTMRAQLLPRTAAYRWLLGEDAASGAARDLWRPNCHGQPGAVPDAQYFCDTSDNGGVHTNSTIPGHGYSLLVDGGSYRDVTVPALGMDKAAAIYFRALSHYATPLTDFAAHADALEASCTSLIGASVPTLTVTPAANPGTAGQVTAADCTAVAAMIAAIGLREEPAQCGFGAMLDQTPQAHCGDGYAPRVLFAEDFTTGLTQWTQSSDVVYGAGTTWPWGRVGSAPAGHGPAAYARATNHGLCSQGVNDVSSRNLLMSPVLQFPAGSQAPRLSFDHYVATESAVDGGNLKVRQDAGWRTVPSSAFLTNAPPMRLNSSATNTNPLAGQAAFSGTDGGESTGSWGTSVIDLAQAGIDPEQPFQFAFDFGRDGCHGIDGWYVDNVTVASCGAKVALTTRQQPSPATFGLSTRLTVTAARDGSPGSVPSGSVSVTYAGRIYSAPLELGAATVTLPTNSAVGTTPVTVSYQPEADFAPTSWLGTIVVAKAKPSLSAFIKAGTGRPGRPLVIIVRASAPGAQVAGKIRLFRGARLLGKGTLTKRGKVTIKVPRAVPPGRLVVRIKYGGSPTVASAVRTQRIR